MNAMQKDTYHIPEMDCPSEEALIRMKLEGMGTIRGLRFDLKERTLSVIHEGNPQEVLQRVKETGMHVEYLGRSAVGEAEAIEKNMQRRILWYVLAINAAFFLIEMVTGWLSRSMGLMADSLDMLADALVYGLSLYAVGRSMRQKAMVARTAGYLQVTLAMIGLAEVIRRFILPGIMPDFQTMVIVSLLALAGNALTLYLLQRTRSSEAHMQASMIFTSNDVIINAGIILAGILVWVSHSKLPDLVVGSIVFIIVIRGAIRILRLANH